MTEVSLLGGGEATEQPKCPDWCTIEAEHYQNLDGQRRHHGPVYGHISMIAWEKEDGSLEYDALLDDGWTRPLLVELHVLAAMADAAARWMLERELEREMDQ